MLNKFKDRIKSLILFGLIFSMPTLKAQVIDTDGDGVNDALDLCPGTTSGTQVNVHGCPVSLTNCDYNTSSFTVVSTPAPAGVQTRYVLADALDGKIVQISNTPTFSNLVGSKTYMVLAYSYEDNGTVVNLNTGNFLNQVNSSCGDWSNGLPFKVCVSPIDNGTCDFNTSSISLASTTPPIGKQTRYVLAEETSGTILQISNTPTFSNLIGTKTYNAYAYSFEDNGTVVHLNTGSLVSQINTSCGDWSNPLKIKVCAPFIDNGTCDFTTSSFSLNLSGNAPVGATTKYLLVNQSGIIVKLADSPTFTGISGTNTFNAYSISYSGAINNLSLGSNISDVTGSCLDWSSPLSVKVCVCNPVCIPVSIARIK